MVCLGGVRVLEHPPRSGSPVYNRGQRKLTRESGFSKRDHFYWKYYAWHGTSKYFVGTVTCHCLCASRDYYRSPLDPELFADRNGGVVSRRRGPRGAP